MSDNLRRYRAIRLGLRQLYPKKLTGRQAQHLETLARFVSGIVASQRCDLSSVARAIPRQATACPKRSDQLQESTVRQMTRWLKHDGIDRATYYLPFVRAVLKALAKQGWITLVIDGSEVGRGCRALVVSAVYGHRALPIAWTVEKGKKGHFSEADHTALLTLVHTQVPAGAKVMLLGDGEFDGIELLGAVSGWGWRYVCRTAKNAQLFESEPFDQEGFPFQEVDVPQGGMVGLERIAFTAERFGPLLAVATWDAAFPDPIYLVSNLDVAEEAIWWYRKRPRIETFFSDQKSRGFHLAHSHLSEPTRLARLMIATCLAYLWVIYLGVTAHREGWLPRIHRKGRCDLSLFQLGLRLLHHLLNEGIVIPFDLPLSPPPKGVR